MQRRVQIQYGSHLDRCIQAVACIWRSWCQYRDRRRFLQLKRLLLQSEHTLTHQLLRRLHPNEVTLLKDPINQARIRFRLGGPHFPPTVYYKIYTRGVHVHYISHQLTWTAPEQACRMMGRQKYMETLTAELGCRQLFDLVHPKDYQRYLSDLDTRPVHCGGRNNDWRPMPDTIAPGVVSVVRPFHAPGGSTTAREGKGGWGKSKQQVNKQGGAGGAKRKHRRGGYKHRWLLPCTETQDHLHTSDSDGEEDAESGMLFAWADALDVTAF